MTQHRANKDIKHGSGVGATSANGNGPAVLLPRHARCTDQTLSRMLRCTLDFRVGVISYR